MGWCAHFIENFRNFSINFPNNSLNFPNYLLPLPQKLCCAHSEESFTPIPSAFSGHNVFVQKRRLEGRLKKMYSTRLKRVQRATLRSNRITWECKERLYHFVFCGGRRQNFDYLGGSFQGGFVRGTLTYSAGTACLEGIRSRQSRIDLVGKPKLRHIERVKALCKRTTTLPPPSCPVSGATETFFLETGVVTLARLPRLMIFDSGNRADLAPGTHSTQHIGSQN